MFNTVTFVTKIATFPTFAVATRTLCTHISYLAYFRFEMFSGIQLYLFSIVRRVVHSHVTIGGLEPPRRRGER
jgi:hypothetical protein